MDQSFTPPIGQRRIRNGGWGTRMAEGGKRLGVTEADYQRVNQAAKATASRDGGWFGWHRLGGSLGLASGHAFGHLWEKYGKRASGMVCHAAERVARSKPESGPGAAVCVEPRIDRADCEGEDRRS